VKTFASAAEVRLAYELGKVGTHDRIALRLPGARVVGEEDDARAVALPPGRRLETTVGRVLFNDLLPPGVPFYNLTMTGKRLARALTDCQRRLRPREMTELIDRLKQAGFAAATRSGVSFALDDIPVPRDKPAALEQARLEVRRLRQARDDGNLAEAEYAELLREAWDRADKVIGRTLMRDLRDDARDGRPYLNPLYVMADSGARGSIDQLRQLAGMRGLMASVSGRLIERPITGNLREGLPSWEHFVSAYGGRKGLSDKGLRTADAGYLTRKLVACAQQVVVTEADCRTNLGIVKSAPTGALAGRVNGRVSLQRIEASPGELVVEPDELISPGQARRLSELGLEHLTVRSPITCRAARGVCQRCYGLDLATGRLVAIGAAVGVVAAQSIGEPGTQLTLRVFHAGGVVGKDIVNDLERVTRLLEGNGGAIDLRQLLRESGPELVAEHLLEQVRRCYRQHGLEIDDRHFEVILARMLGQVQVTRPGHSGLWRGQVLDRRAFAQANQGLPAEDRAACRPCLLGVSQVALRGPGFLAAAGFQRTPRVLAEAALAGAIDPLTGLMENVLLGRRVPAGTGWRRG
jgi:DNA-directed RNA polymerase subunit beta'